MYSLIFTLIVIALVALFFVILKKKNMLEWLPQYIAQRLTKKPEPEGPVHIIFCFVDHYEPQWGRVTDIEVERARVDRWCEDYPKLAAKHTDSDGVHPQHTFFYPEEEYRKEHLDKLAKLCADGYGEIEVHLHHHDDTSENLRATLTRFCNTLHETHGALSRYPDTGELAYGFIHGNWTLDNSGPDGKLCGVNDELIILKDTGCYADFTYPSAPHPTQPKTINSIYYAKDDADRPKSHNTGRQSRVGSAPWGDILMVNGPLMLNWKKLKKGIFPQIENSDIRMVMEPTKDRVDLWVKADIHVQGRPEWKFIKLHTHGTQERDMDTLLGQPVDEMFSYLESAYNDGEKYMLHYVNTREVFNIIRAAEEGRSGNPNEYRDYVLPKPSFIVNS
ncbi:hypothetical protein [Motiliproteus sp. MSK22-1]|uniref:hypothetical protein n=1 Tax=Motiliproteus sp. MSK22-1 TaxID=1897630 RepID=UPI000975E0F7|nr:hypothetical protein [Motiliproteus sp. MSK22-1]OMH25679.1 hypothetical protein BGP75_24370 [Motiliproteus sp. MSK22-1]